MPFQSRYSRDYISQINSKKKPTYNSPYNAQISSKLNEIVSGKNFTYDAEKDPVYQQYKNEYVKLGKDVVQNAVKGAAELTGGYGESYSAAAASEANQQYLTRMSERIPELMNAAMNKYQMEQENNYRQFGALQNEESRQYGQYRDTVSDYENDVAGLTKGYQSALAQENNQRDFDYAKERDEVSDSHKAAELAYKKERDAVGDKRWNEKLSYQRQRDAIKDDQWQKEFDLKKLQYENALKKAKSGRGGRANLGADADSFFKLKGVANMKTYSGNKIDTSRNATLSVTKRNQLLNEMLAAGKDSDVQDLLNMWAYNGVISEGDYEVLVDLFNGAKERGITSFTVKSPKVRANDVEKQEEREQAEEKKSKKKNGIFSKFFK